MAEPHAHSQPIQTYGPAPHNRNIWPHNSRATVFCLRFWPILLFVLVAVVYPLLACGTGSNSGLDDPRVIRLSSSFSSTDSSSSTSTFLIYLATCILDG